MGCRETQDEQEEWRVLGRVQGRGRRVAGVLLDGQEEEEKQEHEEK